MNSALFRGTITTGVTLLGLIAGSMAALGDGYEKKSLKDAPAEEPKRDLQITANFAATSQYVFRGFSQSAENPTIQAGVDLTYKWFYAGLWSSGIDFGNYGFLPGRDFARVEVDYYAGVKPVWGRFTFDFGAIYYTYPRGWDSGFLAPFQELDYFEVKAGASYEIVKDTTTAGLTFFYSPEYTNGTGRVWTVEGAFSHVLPKIRDITPTFSALVGYQQGDDIRYQVLVGNGSDNYAYWNAGITLGFHDRFSVDFRYWDTNVKDTGVFTNFCSGATFQCDERFVVTAKVTY